jgi:hypothetical protein
MAVYYRRSPVGDELGAAFLDALEPLCFDDLLVASDGGDVAEVSAWLGHAVQTGFVEEVDAGTGERCYRLRARGRRVLAAEKRS